MFNNFFNISNNPNETIQEARKQLLFLILVISNFIGLPAIVIGITEALMLKQLVTAFSYVLFYSPILLITLFRKRVSYILGVIIVLISIYLLAVVNLIIYAFSGAAIPLFLTLMVLTTVFLDVKYGLIVILISLISMIITGILFVNNIIILDVTISTITTKTISWITACSVLSLLGVLIVLSYGIIQKKMLNNQSNLKVKAIELEQSNEELKLAREKAEESDRLKTSFLLNISHEVRTPMNGIIGFAKLLQTKDLTAERTNQFTNIIVDSSHQLLAIVDDILDISRIETGQVELYENQINLNVFLDDIKAFFEVKTEEKGLKLNLFHGLNKSESNIIIDDSKLKQIFYNLIGNALKFTEKGSIDFGYKLKENKIEFYVKDSGIGIPVNNQKDIFNRFNKVEHVTDVYGGNGLGLAICKGLIERMNGEIRVESEEGKGSAFYFTLPYNKTPESKEDVGLKKK